MSRPRDACDRFLPSAASITSTRVSFVLDEVVASRSRTFSVSAFATRPVFYADRAFEHPAVSRRRGDCGGWSCRSSNHCRACRASSMCQLADPSAAAHTPKLHLVRFATRSVKTSPLCNPARIPSKGTFLRPSSCDVSRATPGVDPMSRACPAFVGFAANVPSHCAVSPLRYRVAFANAIASARPPCTPAV